jgi:hypothetical protein
MCSTAYIADLMLSVEQKQQSSALAVHSENARRPGLLRQTDQGKYVRVSGTRAQRVADERDIAVSVTFSGLSRFELSRL